MPGKDYYAVLGVAPDASKEAIHKAYRRLAKKHHPDRRGGSKAAEEKFKEITEAYSVLGDEAKRRQYDALRRGGMGGGAFRAEDIFGAGAGGPRVNTEQADFWGSGGMGDMFSKMFGGSRSAQSRTARQRGRDIRSAVTVPFDTAVHGGKVPLTIPRERSCPACSGSGAAPGSKSQTCSTCGGTGQALSSMGGFTVARPCPTCMGRGRMIEKPCPQCGGAGMMETPSRVDVTIPKGIESGRKLRLAGQGEPGVAGGPPGDLLLEVNVAAHPIFQRKGSDIYSKARVDMVDAALGTTIDVQTLQGPVSVKVPAGTQPMQKLRVPGFGMESPDGRKGHHYVEVHVTIPRRLNPEQRKLLEELRKVPARTSR